MTDWSVKRSFERQLFKAAFLTLNAYILQKLCKMALVNSDFERKNLSKILESGKGVNGN